MTIINQSAIYNLNAVLKETGLKADLLRAWEKRYDLPKPQRTEGGHRLYSAHDIEIIKWLKARQSEGLSISRAVELWKEILNSGIDPLERYPQSENKIINQNNATNYRIENLRNNWLDACMKFDGLKAEEILNQAFALYPVETVCVEVLQRGLHLIGESWHQGKTAAQQEHFASALAARRLEALITATPAPTRTGTVLVVGAPDHGETAAGQGHDIGFVLRVRDRGVDGELLSYRIV
ncbi:MAG: MerR family transcriptional regulator, partial [Anaerolineaceae bacterium]|nr:MerR family transcriptional regulator [Anaerolineaceae bacterium]